MIVLLAKGKCKVVFAEVAGWARINPDLQIGKLKPVEKER